MMRNRLFRFLLVTTLLFASNAHAETFRIWIKGFIPNSYDAPPNYLRPVPQQPGKTMIDANLPILGHVCFNTNNRTFSNDPNASAKLTMSMVLAVGPDYFEVISTPAPVVEATQQYDCATGAVICTKTAVPNIAGISQPQMSGSIISFHVEADAGDPCVPVPDDVKPTLKFSGDFKIDVRAGTINYTGTTAQFSSYESYVSLDGKPAILIFKLPPVPQVPHGALCGTDHSTKLLRFQQRICWRANGQVLALRL
jgi:hypothetical protein